MASLRQSIKQKHIQIIELSAEQTSSTTFAISYHLQFMGVGCKGTENLSDMFEYLNATFFFKGFDQQLALFQILEGYIQPELDIWLEEIEFKLNVIRFKN